MLLSGVFAVTLRGGPGVISCLSNERMNEPHATICPVKCPNSRSQVGKLHRCLVKPDTLDLTEQCKEETGLSVEDLAKAEPLDKVLQQVSPCGRLTRAGLLMRHRPRATLKMSCGPTMFPRSPRMSVCLSFCDFTRTTQLMHT